MKLRIAVAFACLAYPSVQVAQKASSPEDTIAGITVGKSKFSDVQRKFGVRLVVDKGRHAVKIEGQCELFFDLEADDSDRPDNRVMNIQLLNLGKGSDPKSPCEEFSTGHGLKLSGSPDSIASLYGLSTTLPRDRVTVDKFSNDFLCEDKHKHAITARNFFVEWSTDSRVIQNISTSVEPANCDDLRSTPKD